MCDSLISILWASSHSSPLVCIQYTLAPRVGHEFQAAISDSSSLKLVVSSPSKRLIDVSWISPRFLYAKDSQSDSHPGIGLCSPVPELVLALPVGDQSGMLAGFTVILSMLFRQVQALQLEFIYRKPPHIRVGWVAKQAESPNSTY